jgi:acetyl-CoA C-acetyltransferase
MTDVYIFDAVRTPRGKGRNGSLQEVPPAHLAAGALRAIRERNALDTAEVDDVVLGCVAPVGEQGSVIGRTAVLLADYDQSVAGMQATVSVPRAWTPSTLPPPRSWQALPI